MSRRMEELGKAFEAIGGKLPQFHCSLFACIEYGKAFDSVLHM